MNNECPKCGQKITERTVYQPNEGPNKSQNVIEVFYHDNKKSMCTRTLEK